MKRNLSSKPHSGIHGKLTYVTLNSSTEYPIQVNMPITNTIVYIIGFIVMAVIFALSGVISICNRFIFSILVVS